MGSVTKNLASISSKVSPFGGSESYVPSLWNWFGDGSNLIASILGEPTETAGPVDPDIGPIQNRLDNFGSPFHAPKSQGTGVDYAKMFEASSARYRTNNPKPEVKPKSTPTPRAGGDSSNPSLLDEEDNSTVIGGS